MVMHIGVFFLNLEFGTRSSELVISSKFGIKKARNATRARTPTTIPTNDNKTLKIM